MSIVTTTSDGDRTVVSTTQFSSAWWFREEFEATPSQAGRRAGLIFEGVNYCANVWLNGARIATVDETRAAFRISNLEIPGRLEPGKNIVAVEVLFSRRVMVRNGKHQPRHRERLGLIAHPQIHGPPAVSATGRLL